MRAAGDDAHGRRLRGLIVILWRAGLRIQEALALAESDLDQRRGAVLVRRGKGGRRREVGMDAVDELVLEQPPGQRAAAVHLQPTPRLGFQLANGRRDVTGQNGRVVCARVWGLRNLISRPLAGGLRARPGGDQIGRVETGARSGPFMTGSPESPRARRDAA
jgi:hypothetical protein